MKALVVLLVVVATGISALAGLRLSDRRDLRAEWSRLAAHQPATPPAFSAEMVAALPEPARRFFAFSIREGAPVLTVAEIRMQGRFALGNRDTPSYRAMQARQILAAPEGFVWAMRTHEGLPISGSDAARWSRFRVLGLVPVARAGGNSDFARSAFGRLVAEAVFWTPAAVLPGPGVRWQAVDADTSRVVVRHAGLEQAVDVTVDAAGRPRAVELQRWTNANPARRFRYQPFGGRLSDFREVAGYRLPFRVEAGNMFGTDDYFPFFIAEVTDIRFPRADG